MTVPNFNFNFEQMSVDELLQLHAAAIEELRARDILRSKNNPTGDYCEWLVVTKMGMTLAAKSTAGHDAVDAHGLRYQIKGRRVTADNKSRQLGGIRDLANRDFDYLIGIVLDTDFKVFRAFQIPHAVIESYAKFSKHTNAHILHLRDKLGHDPRIKDLKPTLTCSPEVALRPKRFDLFIGGYMGKSYGIRLDGGHVVYEQFSQGHTLTKTLVLDPANQDWATFAAQTDRLNAWKWKRSYGDKQTDDGTNWSMNIVMGRKKIQSKGSNAFPDGFKSFCAAVSLLLGGRHFA